MKQRNRSSFAAYLSKIVVFQLICCVNIFIISVCAEMSKVEKAEKLEDSLKMIHAISSGATGFLCVTETERYKRLPVSINHTRWRIAQVKATMAAVLMEKIGFQRKELLEAVAMSLNFNRDPSNPIQASRVLTVSSGKITIQSCTMWNGTNFMNVPGTLDIAVRKLPWYPYELTEENKELFKNNKSLIGVWTTPFYSCDFKSWMISYTILQKNKEGPTGVVSVDVNVSNLIVNQCEIVTKQSDNEMEEFYGTHKCPILTTKCEYRVKREIGQETYSGWSRGNYVCVCKDGYYSTTHPRGVNGSLVEVAFQESLEQNRSEWSSVFDCKKCQEGCLRCSGPEPCLAYYNWPFRITLLVISVACAILTVFLAVYTRVHRRAKVFKAASPVFLSITLFGCAIMYMEMAAIFPILGRYSCIATKWTRHMGFCITYTSLLMKTWRVSLTYRVKSAHKLKLTDKQLLQWMAPVVFVMLVYLGTWTLSATPDAEDIKDKSGLRFKQCIFNWWDHSIGMGEIIFLLWGVRVCYRVRHAESLYNEARQISFAIYNIAIINLIMLAFHIQIFPRAGPDIKYFLGFIRIQLSTTTTILLVFAPKIMRIITGSDDTLESRVSSTIKGVGLVTEEPYDVYQENDELKEEIQKLATQIEFMKTVQMVLYNRHLRPKAGSYFITSGGRNTFMETTGPV